MERLIRWVAAAIVVTAVFGAIYVIAQQVERQGADDAPTRLASQVASQLRHGQTAAPTSAQTVRIDESDAEFFVVYDRQDRPLFGTGVLDGELAAVPRGVIDSARESARGTVTWEPRAGLRFAVDPLAVGGRVVIAGESLAPVEQRIDRLGLLVLVAWGATILVLAVAFGAEQALATAGRRRPGEG